MTRPNTSFAGNNLCALPERDAVRLMKLGQVSPAELLQTVQARIKQVEPQVNAVVIRADDRAQAQLADPPAHGAANATASG